jgi:hypothetical protein
MRNHSQSCHFLCQKFTGVTHWNMFSSKLPYVSVCDHARGVSWIIQHTWQDIKLAHWKTINTNINKVGQTVLLLDRKKTLAKTFNRTDIEHKWCQAFLSLQIPEMSSMADWSFKSALFPKRHFNVWRWTFYGDASKPPIIRSISNMRFIVGGSSSCSTGLMTSHSPQHSPGSPDGWEEGLTLPPE